MSNFMPFLFLFYFITSIFTSDGTQLIVVNNCKDPIWPGILTTAARGPRNTKQRQFSSQQRPTSSGGMPEALVRTNMGPTGLLLKGSCQTGDCVGKLHCTGFDGEPQATLVEMTLGTSSNPGHYYDVSLVDGFNLPVSIIPVGGGRGCGVAMCESDLNGCCPAKLALRRGGKVVVCKSACLAMREDRYRCTGEYTSPETCKRRLSPFV